MIRFLVPLGICNAALCGMSSSKLIVETGGKYSGYLVFPKMSRMETVQDIYSGTLDKSGERMRFRGFVTKINRLVVILLFMTLVSGINLITPAQAQNQNSVNLERFDMLTTTSGWVLLGQQLFWTSDAGNTWNEISPSLPSDASVQDVDFVDADTAWVLWSVANPEGTSLFHLSHTNDHGRIWVAQPLILFELG